MIVPPLTLYGAWQRGPTALAINVGTAAAPSRCRRGLRCADQLLALAAFGVEPVAVDLGLDVARAQSVNPNVKTSPLKRT